MKRVALLLLVVLTAVPLFADSSRSRAVASPPQMSGASVSGEVTGVNGSIVSLANGLVNVNVSNAKIYGADGQQTATITPGSVIFALLAMSQNATPISPLQASIVTVTHPHDVTISGAIQAVDTVASTITVLGLAIKVTTGTTIHGFREGDGALHLSDLKTNETALINADVRNGALVAYDIHVTSLIPQPSLSIFMGTVKSIANDAWIVTVGGKDTRFVIDAQTHINGQPKVGDTVNVIATTNNAGAYVAIAITGGISLPTPTQRVKVTGTLKSIDATSAVVNNGIIDTRFTITSTTKIIGSPKAGDRVEAVGEQSPLAIYPPIINATTITKL